MQDAKCTDPIILNLWHPISAVADLAKGRVQETRLLGERVCYTADEEGGFAVWLSPAAHSHGSVVAAPDVSDRLPAKSAYGYLWASLGDPVDLFPLPEYDEADRRRFNSATFGVNVSAPRAVENFLDLGHLPYVHPGILGEEPHTEVREYDVEISAERDEVLATRCKVFQPRASSASTSGQDVDYIFRVPHPYCSVLYKWNPVDETRMDVVAIFMQAVSQEQVRVHFMSCVLDDVNEDRMIKRFHQTIFGQDKPILENQHPKRLPLDPRAETPIRADKSAIAYRRWLSQKGVTYGVIPASQ
ncbi:aromatic ring-hydroxylating dioxygenase subunit alpha [Nitratireductor mangrovi]|uniref:Aromatic ring-hydroxylating dioxygenase subunit alpha n=1 Tax=Nitratireductor mangrovi TaxID=2599600 RepID=A0A5B8L5R1_9HYPH|nr:aromatic ring-hydroxylating dioxygenase subunit alpha [Nitratireductor mangrovi]QDZ03275.1 aromatic ring-hydroxylating dioxygenase subunit alpha [Nitratireductor mangrovi]